MGGAIGFAIYLDALERLGGDARDYDVETALFYRRDDDPARVGRAARELSADGASVMALTEAPAGLRYRRAVKLTESGVAPLD